MCEKGYGSSNINKYILYGVFLVKGNSGEKIGSDCYNE